MSRREGDPYQHGFGLRFVPAMLAEPLTSATSNTGVVTPVGDLCHTDVAEDCMLSVAKVMQLANGTRIRC